MQIRRQSLMNQPITLLKTLEKNTSENVNKNCRSYMAKLTKLEFENSKKKGFLILFSCSFSNILKLIYLCKISSFQ